MEDLNLTETEMRYFGDLFLCCDEESNGKIPILKATELFRSSNIPNDVLKQIMDISVAPNICASLNHLNRKQFYSALKLIAAHQINMPLKPELLCTAVELPLPRFTWTISGLNSEASADLIQLSNSPKEQHMVKRERNFVSSIGAYEPMRLSSNLSDSDVPQTLSHDVTEGLSTDSEKESETMSQRSSSHGRRGKNGSPWSTASESPTPTNSVAERVHPVWEHSATGRGVWPANTGEEHTRLLGTEEESSDRHSSEEEGEEGGNVWSCGRSQAQYYFTQFLQLRPERGMVPGHVARSFFEKSRLPVADLRKIWQLADVTKDGMLTLKEFIVAMHLVVLRRNNIPVPDTLPPGLDAVEFGDIDYSEYSDMTGSATSADFNIALNFGPKPEGRRPSPSPKPEPPPSKEWTKFVDSPTSSVSSPGPKPVNFDFQRAAVERDPKIFHPVALRATPDAALDELRASTSPRRDEPPPDAASPKPANGVDIRPVQRPQPRKPLKSSGALPPPPPRDAPDEGGAFPKKEPPPPPPPRPLRNHARSSSLDLNRLKGAPPPPPRDYEPEGFGYNREEGGRSQGAFEVYRRGGGAELEPDERALLEQNAVLHRVCRALQRELADAARERELLHVRLTNNTH